MLLCKSLIYPQGGTGTMADLRDSPRAADVRQGLDMIEHAHRLGGAKFKSASGASSGRCFCQRYREC